MNWARFDGNPCVYEGDEAWVLPSLAEGWRKIAIRDMEKHGSAMTEADFESFFRFLPPLPNEAFGGRSPIPAAGAAHVPYAPKPSGPITPTYRDIGRRVRNTKTGQEGIITSFDEGHEHARPATTDEKIYVHYDDDKDGVARETDRAELEWSRFHHGQKPPPVIP